MERDEALKRQFVREVRIGIALIGVTLSAFVLVAYVKLRGSFGEVDEVATSQISPATTDPQPVIAHGTPPKISALQAATVSMLDHVDVNVGGTSPIKSPPMPAPRVFPPPAVSTPENRGAVIPTTDSSINTSSEVSSQSDQLTFPMTGITNHAPRQTQNPATTGFSDTNIAAQISTVPTRPLTQSRSAFPVRRVAAETISFSTEADAEAGLQVNAGESLWTIAQRHYGDGRFFRALAAFNRLDQDGNGRPLAGSVLRLPSQQTLRTSFPELVPADSRSEAPEIAVGSARTYVTFPDDSLFSIARDELGQASRYIEIIALNADSLPKTVTASGKLPSGVRLALPKE